jgi:hypothetical protein
VIPRRAVKLLAAPQVEPVRFTISSRSFAMRSLTGLCMAIRLAEHPERSGRKARFIH